MFKLRLLTAVIAVPLVLLAIFYFPISYFSIAMLAVTAIGAWEWSALVSFKKILWRLLFVLIVLAGVLFAPRLPIQMIFNLAFVVVLWATIAVILYQLKYPPAGFQWPIFRAIAGIILLVSFCWAAIFLKSFPFVFGGEWLLFYVMLLVWVADTAGYFVGRAFGKHLMIPRVSPKKTWEGLAGSLVSGFLIALGFAFLILNNNQIFSVKFIIISFFAVIFSVPGDLFVSLLKRQAGVKDSGVIFPGHGGMLDRLDSLIAGAIVFVAGIFLYLGT